MRVYFILFFFVTWEDLSKEEFIMGKRIFMKGTLNFPALFETTMRNYV